MYKLAYAAALLPGALSMAVQLPQGEPAKISRRDLGIHEGLQTRDNGYAWQTELSADDALTALVEGVKVWNNEYFDLYAGTWPKGNDWTRSAMASQLAGVISTFSHALLNSSSSLYDVKIAESYVTDHFSHLMSFYYGQNAVSLQNQLFDDKQWVVLAWLDTIKAIKLNQQIFNSIGTNSPSSYNHEITLTVQDHWFGADWTPAFAHRARVFWDLASVGWDDSQCGGGMKWEVPKDGSDNFYKNAITNELFISTSANMYQWFPGDNNVKPFDGSYIQQAEDPFPDVDMSSGKQQTHLDNAKKAHDWLAGIKMQNSNGLYGDGYHDKCTNLDSTVYTYNQGVILSGLKTLFDITGDSKYLDEGHELIQDVILASGWNLTANEPRDPASTSEDSLTHFWGIGRVGVMEERNDADQSADNNADIFKGIYWHHLAAFCVPYEEIYTATTAPDSHQQQCKSYVNWVRHNAIAALGTRNSDGLYGMWWTWGLFNNGTTATSDPNSKRRNPEIQSSALSVIRAYYEMVTRL